MNKILCLGFLSIIMALSLVGITSAGESLSYIVHVQGGESRITNGSDGKMEITVMDITSNVSITNGNRSYSIPVSGLINLTLPVDAAVVLSGAKNESISMIRISNVSLSTDLKNLTLQVSPLRFYDGEGLKSFAANQTEILSGRDRGIKSTDLYIETSVEPAENSGKTCPSGQFYCGMYDDCRSMSEWSTCSIT